VLADDIDLNSLKLVLQPNYYDGYSGNDVRMIEASAAEYLSQQRHNAYAGLMCVETPVPRNMGDKIKFCVDDARNSGEAIGLIHAGHNGSIAPLHFDWDHRLILHACVTGSKTLFFIPPDAGWMLNPIINTSPYCLPRFSRRDRLDFLKRLGGIEVKLNTGEAVLFPSLWWHAVRYNAPTFSVSLRFGEHRALRPFAVLPRSFWLQRLVWHFFQHRRADPTPYISRCLEAFLRPHKSWVVRYHVTNSIYRDSLLALKLNGGAKYLAADGFNTELRLAKNEVQNLYTLEHSRKYDHEVQSTIEYLFEEYPSLVPLKMRVALAKYALAKRQGLRARRGLVTVLANSEDNRMRSRLSSKHPMKDHGDVKEIKA
jgi:hypothetical protein